MSQNNLTKFCLLLLWLFSTPLWAATRIAILDFELHDLTLAPRIPAEIQRTASIKNRLEQELRSAGYQIITIDFDAQHKANSGFGYLFEHSDIAANLANKFGADYVLVGKLHKPSYLFAYLMGHLVNSHTGRLVGNYVIETKGSDLKLTRKAVESLTSKIDADLDHLYTFPTP